MLIDSDGMIYCRMKECVNLVSYSNDAKGNIFEIYKVAQTLADAEDEANIERESAVDRDSKSQLFIDFAFGGRIKRLENIARYRQYQLAYISTLGGAYHLCNKPKVALGIAKKQEQVGRSLGSSSVIIRAKLFQAVNLRMLGKSKRSQKELVACKEMIEDVLVRNPVLGEEMRSFVQSNEEWLNKNYPSSGEQVENSTLVDMV